jgi:hypothetical protein
MTKMPLKYMKLIYKKKKTKKKQLSTQEADIILKILPPL